MIKRLSACRELTLWAAVTLCYVDTMDPGPNTYFFNMRTLHFL